MIRSSPLGRVELELPRRRLSERLRALGIRDERVLEAIANVPRHLLIPEPLRGQAYKDVSLPIGAGQTISAPSTVAAMMGNSVENMALPLPRAASALATGIGGVVPPAGAASGSVFAAIGGVA